MLSIDPTYRGRHVALLRRIMHLKLNSTVSDEEYITKLSEWQQVVREYERISGSELDQTVKTATLMDEAPPQMQEHLRLRTEEIGTDYRRSRVTCARRKLGTLALMTWTLTLPARAKVSPKVSKGRRERKSRESKSNENSKSDRKCFVRLDIFCQRL